MPNSMSQPWPAAAGSTINRAVGDRRRPQPRGGHDRDRTTHRRADQRDPACPSTAQLADGGGHVVGRAAAPGARGGAEAAQVEEQRVHAMVRQVAGRSPLAAGVARVLVDQHRADRPPTTAPERSIPSCVRKRIGVPPWTSAQP